MTYKTDPHHCHCFLIHSNYHELFKQYLIDNKFKDPILQEDHGQKFGLTKRLDEETQIHVKLLKNGIIEGEMEYPPDYPVAHLNKEHSYSAHPEIEQILNSMRIAYTKKIVPPTTCVKRIIRKAFKPTHKNTFIAGAIVTAVLIGGVYYLSKRKTKEG